MTTFSTLWHTPWGAVLVNHIWQSTVFVLGIWLLTLALRKNRASVRHSLWLLASLKFLAPFSLLIALGERLHRHTAIAATPQLAAAMNSFAQPFSAAGAGKVPSAAAAGAAAAMHLLPGLLLVLWAGGVCYLLMRWAWQWWRIRTAVKAAAPLDLGLALPVLSAPVDLEPGVFGMVRPVLLLPASLSERLSPAQLDAIIAHEVCHVRRRDNLSAALHMLVQAIFWFHPAVWWIGSRLVEERERACDEAVLESTGEALTYAEGILNVCKSYVEAPLSCVAGVTGGELKQRIARIVSRQTGGKLGGWRKLLLALAAVVVVAAPLTTGLMRGLQAQEHLATAPGDIEGTWQGTVRVPPKDQRVVWKITKTEAGRLKVMMYSIDQAGPPVAASSPSFDGGVFKYVVEPQGVSYEGKMSADHQSIAGAWKQGKDSGPLVLERAMPANEWAIPEPPAAIPPMAADADPSFEVATIRPSKPDTPGKTFTAQGRRMVTTNTTVVDLIVAAWGIQTKQIVNAPAWLASDKFDITAQPDTPGIPSREQRVIMGKKLLADRFQMKFHEEQREMSAYVLTVVKNGPKLKKSDGNPNGLPRAFFRQPGVLTVHDVDMATFAKDMQFLDRPVVDHTGLEGKWDFILTWTPDESQFSGMGIKVPPPSDAADAPPPLFTAIQEQIGLKLSVEKALVPVLVIDHIEKPSEN